MKTFNLPKDVRLLIFDIDLTLYEDHDYYDSQERLLIERLAEYLKIPSEEAREKVSAIREEHKSLNEGRSLSLGNTFLRFGVSIEKSVHWRDELFQPEEFLEPDEKLKETLEKLKKDYKIAAVTNNTTNIGIRTLKSLEVGEYFPIVIGLDISGESKPTLKPFKMISEELNIPLNQIVSVGDRFAIDLEIPLKHGMGGILIEKISDVYELPGILSR